MGTGIVLSHPAAGHINPTLPVVAELVRRGEKILYYATEPFRERVEKTGAIYQSYGPQDLFERNLNSGGMLGGMAGLIETTREILPPLVEALKAEEADYLISDSHALWGNFLIQILQKPGITFCSMFAFHECIITNSQLIQHLYRGSPKEFLLDGLKGLTRYFERASELKRDYAIDLPGLVDYLGNPQQLNIVFTSQEFQLGGEKFDPQLYKFVGPTNVLPASNNLAKGERPLVYISLGTMYNNDVDFYHMCFEAFANTPFQVLMSTGHRLNPSLLLQPPSNFTLQTYFPQLEVLQKCQLFITHGGMNSAQEGIYYGVPMIVLPQQADHFVVANRVQELGLGLIRRRGEVTAEWLRESAFQVIDNQSFKSRSEQIGQSFRQAGGTIRAVEEIFQFLKGNEG